jgi:hypothetical protein
VNLTADLYLVLRSRKELRITFIFRKKGILTYTAAKTFKTQKQNAVVRPKTRRFSWCGVAVAYPGILFGGGSTNSVEDRGQRERGSGGGSPLVRGSGGSCS